MSLVTWRVTPTESLVLDSDDVVHLPTCDAIALDGHARFIEAATSWEDDSPYLGRRDCPECLPDGVARLLLVEPQKRYGYNLDG